jgi:hypothetical protein
LDDDDMKKDVYKILLELLRFFTNYLIYCNDSTANNEKFIKDED